MIILSFLALVPFSVLMLLVGWDEDAFCLWKTCPNYTHEVPFWNTWKKKMKGATGEPWVLASECWDKKCKTHFFSTNFSQESVWVSRKDESSGRFLMDWVGALSFLQCFDDGGWVTYNVFSGTLNPTQSKKILVSRGKNCCSIAIKDLPLGYAALSEVNWVLVHGQVTIIFVVSVCLSVCLCRVFLSRLWSDFDQTWTYVICLGLVVSPNRGCATPGAGWPLKNLYFYGFLGLKKPSRPTVLIGLCWFLAIL